MGDDLTLTATEFVAASVVADAVATGDWSALRHLIHCGEVETAREVLRVVAELDLEDLVDLTVQSMGREHREPAGSVPMREAIARGRKARNQARAVRKQAEATRERAAAGRRGRR